MEVALSGETHQAFIAPETFPWPSVHEIIVQLFLHFCMTSPQMKMSNDTFSASSDLFWGQCTVFCQLLTIGVRVSRIAVKSACPSNSFLLSLIRFTAADDNRQVFGGHVVTLEAPLTGKADAAGMADELPHTGVAALVLFERAGMGKHGRAHVTLKWPLATVFHHV